MLYQIRTFGDLCASKKYLKKSQLSKHILEVVEKTKKHRESLSVEELIKLRYGKSVTEAELMESIGILKVDPDMLPDYERILGKSYDIGLPIDLDAIEQERKNIAKAKRNAIL